MESTPTSEPPKSSGIMGYFRFFGRLLRGYLLSVGIFVTFFPLIITLLIFFLSPRSESSKVSPAPSAPKDDLILEMNFSGPIDEDLPDLEEQIVNRIFGVSHAVNLPHIRTALRRAAQDKRVKAVHVEMMSLSGSMTQFTELHRLFKSFRDSGKPLFVWTANPHTYSYYLATTATEIALQPTSSISIPGPGFQLTYFADALKKVGIDMEIVRAGKYKSAVEPFIRNDPSAEAISMYQSIEGSLRDEIVTNVATARQKPVETVRNWFRQSYYIPKAALEEGLVDVIGFRDEQRDRIEKALKEDDRDLDFISVKKYLQASEDLESDAVASGDEGIGLIVAKGNIVAYQEESSGSKVITPAGIKEQVEWAMENDDVKSVVLRISSPGGSATASDIIWRDLSLLAAKKPLVVSMGSSAASGGYYIAAPAQRIIAEPSTITGSIGVFGLYGNLEPFKEKYGVSFHIVTQSDRRDYLNPGKRSSAFDKDIISTGVDDIYQTFLARVAAGRKIDVSRVHELGQGRVFTGLEALDNGLVDELGGVNEAFRAAKELAKLDTEKLYPILRYTPGRLDLSQCLRGIGKLIECVRQLETRSLLSAIGKRVGAPTRDWLWLRGPELQATVRLLRDETFLALWPHGWSAGKVN